MMQTWVDGRIVNGARIALDALDNFMSGKETDPLTLVAALRVAEAGSFALTAFERLGGEAGTHAMTRAFLLALIDPTHPDLDYLRADPATGQAARDAQSDLARIARDATP